MTRPYIIVASIPKAEKDTVKAIKKEDYVPGLHEPITGAYSLKDAEAKAKKINDIGGATEYLKSVCFLNFWGGNVFFR